MSDSAVDKVNMQSDEQVQPQMTAGAMLRRAREEARVQLPTLAATLKVPQGKLEALEADDYGAFPDHVFMRALAMGVCRTLHVDAAPVLAALPRTELKSLSTAGTGINATVKERSHLRGVGASFGGSSSGSRKVVAGVLVLLAAAAAVYFVPLHQGEDAGPQQADAPAAPAVGAAGATGAVSSASVVVEVPAAAGNAGEGAAAASASAAPVQTPAAPVPAAGEAAVPAASPAEAPAPVPAPAAEPAQASGAVLEMRASAQSWIKVKDAKGKVVLEKTLAKDESVTASGELPLSVVVGNAKGTQVLVRGEPLDIAGTRDNVARFEVK
jgi:cytoskeleton protein RodZ